MSGNLNAFNFWSRVNTLELAEEASRSAFSAAMFCGAITSALAIASYFGITPIAGVSLLTLFDAAIFFGLGWGVRRYSRICAVLLFLYYGAEQGYSLTHRVSANAVVTVLFLVFFARGIRGAFAFHRLRSGSAPVVRDA